MKHVWCLLFLVGCKPSVNEVAAPIARVHCVGVSSEPWPDVRTLRGTVSAQPDGDAMISAQVPGRLVRVLVREGDTVEQGALLAEVEAQPLRDVLRLADTGVAQARAARDAAQVNATREQHLFERGISARQTWDATAATLSQAQSALSAASVQADVARQNLARTQLRSPITGVVVRLVRRSGEAVDGTPSTPVLEVADIGHLELLASAPAVDLIALRTGQKASLRFDALGDKEMNAQVRSVSPSVDGQSGVGTVRLSIDSGEVRLPLGLPGVAQVVVAQGTDALVVPPTALRNVGGTSVELVACEGGKAKPIAVKVQSRRGDKVSVIGAGVTSGSRVVTDGVVGLTAETALEELP